MPNAKKGRLSKTVGTVLTVVGLTGGVLLTTTAATQANTSDIPAQLSHFIECFGWMLTDPDLHAQNCGPGFYPGYDAASDIGGGGHVYLTTTETMSGTVTVTVTHTITVSGTVTSTDTETTTGTDTGTNTVTTTVTQTVTDTGTVS